MGGKPRAKRKRVLLRLQARPRVAPLGWPHWLSSRLAGEDAAHTIAYKWVYVKSDGSGWTTGGLDCWFPEEKLEEVIEGFYASAGPWPFDFLVEKLEEKNDE